MIAIRFTYDVDGLLEVEAAVEETGRKFTGVFTQHVENLDETRIREAIENLQRLKFYPREDVENRRLLLFAERVLGQISPYQRESLESAVDAYESALHDTEREWFDVARNALLQTLSALDHPFDGHCSE